MNKLTKLGMVSAMTLLATLMPFNTLASGTVEPTTIEYIVEESISPVIEIGTESTSVSLADNDETNGIIVTIDESEQLLEEVEPEEDRQQGLYILSKNGYVLPNQHIDIQWLIHDMCEQYDIPERWMMGMILAESTFDTNDVSSSGCTGLTQISGYWLRSTVVPELEPGRRSRNLRDPYQNILTTIEMMHYARDKYGIDLNSEQGFKDYAYWHNTGKFKQNVSWDYSNKCIRFGNELTAIQ